MAGVTIGGARKAAVLLLQLGKDRAAEVLASMDDAEIQMVTAELVRLAEVNETDAISVLTEFVGATTDARRPRGGAAFTKEVLTKGIGAERASALIARMAPSTPGLHFASLSHMEPRALAALLVEEHPQVTAVVLSSVGPDRALRVLRALPVDVQGDVAYRVATMAPPSPEVIAQVEAGLERRLASVAEPNAAPAGSTPLERLVALLSNADKATETTVLGRLDALDPALASEVRQHLLTFDDLVRLDDRGTQALLRELDTKTLAMALKGAGAAVTEKITSNLSARAAANLADEIDLLGPQRKSDIEGARMTVIAKVRELEDAGELSLTRGEEDLVD